MRKGTLLIAISNEESLLAITELLEPHCQLTVCRDGKTALETLRQAQFDLILLDLMLTHLDGLSLLEQAQAEGCCPPALALSPLLNPYIEETARRLGILYMLRPPCDFSSLSKRALELMGPKPIPVSTSNRQFLSALLLELPMGAHLDGYQFLIESTLRFYQDPSQRFSKELYHEVGKHFGHTGNQVERSIRSALDRAWENRNNALWQRLFACGEKRPSASRVISRLAEQLRQREGTNEWTNPGGK